MRIAIIVYHKNIGQYPKEWIKAFRDSILYQTFVDFDVFEMDYGGDGEVIFEPEHYYNSKLGNFSEAMNLLIDECFQLGYDYICNTNIDDIFALDRIERQYTYMQLNYDVISSNFSLIEDDKIVHTHYFDKLDLKLELAKNHNILCHPSICLSKKFWENNRYIPSEVPLEDLKLWQRGVKGGYKFIILSEILCFHRLHKQSVGHKGEEI